MLIRSLEHEMSSGVLPPLRLVVVALLAGVLLGGCSDPDGDAEDAEAPEAAQVTTTAPVDAEDDGSAQSAPTSVAGGDAPSKLLVADGSLWGCPGTFCGPDVSRYSTTRYDPVDRLAVTSGVEVVAECQTPGASITDPVTGVSTTMWIRTSQQDDKPWMSAHYFGTTDFDAVLSGIPPC